MSKTTWTAIIIVIVAIAGAIYFTQRDGYPEVLNTDNPNLPREEGVPTGETISVTGIWECLPHKVQGEVQTLECALGVAVDQSDAHYALDLSAYSGLADNLPTGTHIRVTGKPVSQNSSNEFAFRTYPIDGIIAVTSIEEI